MLKKYLLSFLLLACLYLKPPSVLAVCADGISTSIGCIPIDPQDLVVNYVLKYAIGIAGGVAFLLIIWGAIQLLTSAGDPEKIGKGKETIVAAISGLLFIIFSIYLLRLIGYDILRIPGFETP